MSGKNTVAFGLYSNRSSAEPRADYATSDRPLDRVGTESEGESLPYKSNCYPKMQEKLLTVLHPLAAAAVQ